MSTFEGFEPIFGAAQGQLETATSHGPAQLPFLLCLRASDSDHLVIHVTDFHANTWCANMSTEFLDDLKEDVGIGGEWEDFVRYVRAVFVSDNVKIHLRGSPSVMINEGATSATLSGQKAERSPKLRFVLTKLQGKEASDVMGSISVEMFKVFRSQAASLSSESARAIQMSTAYMQEKARADLLQEKLDALSFTKKKTRSRPTLSVDDPSLAQPLATQSIMVSQFATPSVFEDLGTQGAKAAGSSGQMEPPKAKPATKVGLSGPRLRAAPIRRKPKRRPTVDSDDDD
ncbi:hypothetical protein M758_3G018200 [Ceratodon purpureus]|nr:hypothetical protein M758_3G018200 [Ceratodon purpureus]